MAPPAENARYLCGARRTDGAPEPSLPPAATSSPGHNPKCTDRYHGLRPCHRQADSSGSQVLPEPPGTLYKDRYRWISAEPSFLKPPSILVIGMVPKVSGNFSLCRRIFPLLSCAKSYGFSVCWLKNSARCAQVNLVKD